MCSKVFNVKFEATPFHDDENEDDSGSDSDDDGEEKGGNRLMKTIYVLAIIAIYCFAGIPLIYLLSYGEKWDNRPQWVKDRFDLV